MMAPPFNLSYGGPAFFFAEREAGDGGDFFKKLPGRFFSGK
jgi:hypothetical protein